MKKITLYTLITFLFVQCGSISSLDQVKRLVNKSANLQFLNPTEFESARKLMLEKLDNDILSSDTIIIFELFPDGTGSPYNTSIYESNNRTVRSYYAVRNTPKLTADSLAYTPIENKILTMVINGEIERVKDEGKNSTATPASKIIINIITKDEKGKFTTRTVLTNSFFVPMDFQKDILFLLHRNKIKQ